MEINLRNQSRSHRKEIQLDVPSYRVENIFSSSNLKLNQRQIKTIKLIQVKSCFTKNIIQLWSMKPFPNFYTLFLRNAVYVIDPRKYIFKYHKNDF